MLPENRTETVADRLDSWKDIAVYLRRDVTTVQRWEKREGLPVHRHLHDKQGSVYAFRSELDDWWQQGKKRLEAAEALQRPPGTRPQRHRVWRASVAAGELGLVAAVVVGVWWRTTTVERPPEVVRSQIPLPSDAVGALALAFSPDASQLVYVGWTETSSGPPHPSQLFLKATRELTSRPLDGTLRGVQPFFSPDGKWIGFFAAGQLKKIAATGGPVTALWPAPVPRGGTWGPDNTIVFAPDWLTGLWRVSADGGEARVLTIPDRARLERTHREPRFLPGGRAVLFTVQRADRDSFDEADIEAVELATGRRIPIARGGTQAVYTASGHLVYGRGGTLLAAPFDLARLRVTGTPMAVVRGVHHDPSMGRVAFAVSAGGTLVYAQGAAPPGRQLVWVDRGGHEEPLHTDRRPFAWPRISPDGRHVAVTVDSGVPRIWIHDVLRGTLTPRTSGWDAEVPLWAPNGERVAYSGHTVVADGRLVSTVLSLTRDETDDDAVPLLMDTVADGPDWEAEDWSPDGTMLAVHRTNPGTQGDIVILEVPGNAVVRSIAVPGNQSGTRFSRDGGRIAYVSNESGRHEIYVQELYPPGRRWQVSTNGGIAPVWARGTDEIFYLAGRELIAARFTAGRDFVVTRRDVLFQNRFSLDNTLANYDVGPGGRFVMVRSDWVGSRMGQPLVLVQDWFEELRQKVPSP